MADQTTPAPPQPIVAAELAPETKRSEVLVQLTRPWHVTAFRYPTGDKNDDGSPEFVEVRNVPTVVANKTVADKIIKSAEDHGITIATVKVED